jgi:hypothetical protein
MPVGSDVEQLDSWLVPVGGVRMFVVCPAIGGRGYSQA